MGNLVPLACSLPAAAIGVYLMVKEEAVTGLGIGLCILALIVGWLAVNQFGLFGNIRLKRTLLRRLAAKAGRDASSGIFVGFARPSYVGVLDAHEDLGFLFVDEDALEYVGELHQVMVARKDVKGIRFRGNIHSALGLGRWISIDAVHKGKPVRLLVEPREESTLLANRKRGTRLKKRLEEWRKQV